MIRNVMIATLALFASVSLVACGAKQDTAQAAECSVEECETKENCDSKDECDTVEEAAAEEAAVEAADAVAVEEVAVDAAE